jgi:putative Mn2+ efflux pump MntP
LSLVENLLLALALSADAFSVGAAVGLEHGAPRQVFRLAFHFGLFQALMPLLGALAGTLVLDWIAAFDHWVAFGLLAFVGGRMIAGSFSGATANRPRDPTRGLSLIGLSLAVSIDALAAGFTLAVERAPLLRSVVIIGLVAAAATALGMRLAGRVRRLAGKRCELFAGLILVGLGAKILVEHLSA